MSNLIFNPAYSLKDDIHRVLLVDTPSFNVDAQINFIHPEYAFILSCFNGKNTSHEAVMEVATHFGVNYNEARKIIQPLVNNPKKVGIRFEGIISTFPPYVLIENNYGITRDDTIDFKHSKITDYDYTTKRLYKPMNLLICPTLRCYTNCIYCYANRRNPHLELSPDKWAEIIRSAKIKGINRIDITGGEFYLYPGWRTIAEALVSNGFQPEISTKVPLCKNVLNDIKRIGLKSVQFSLDTLDVELAQQTLNVDSDYITKLKDSIIYADEIGLEIILKPTLSRKTASYTNICELYQFATTLVHIKRVVVSIIGYSCYKSDNNYTSIKPDQKQIEDVRNAIVNISKYSDFPIHDDTFVYLRRDLQNKNVFVNRAACTANVEGFVILPDGTATICEELYWNKNFIIGNAKTQGIDEIWNSDDAIRLWKLSQQDMPNDSSCQKCEIFDKCHKGAGICWKLVIWAYGHDNPYYPDPRCPKAPDPKHKITGD